MAKTVKKAQRVALLDERATGKAAAVITLAWGVVGLVWHGLLGQPTLAALLYPGFSWVSVTGVAVWIGVTILAYVTGYLFARAYNKVVMKKA